MGERIPWTLWAPHPDFPSLGEVLYLVGHDNDAQLVGSYAADGDYHDGVDDEGIGALLAEGPRLPSTDIVRWWLGATEQGGHAIARGYAPSREAAQAAVIASARALGWMGLDPDGDPVWGDWGKEVDDG